MYSSRLRYSQIKLLDKYMSEHVCNSKFVTINFDMLISVFILFSGDVTQFSPHSKDITVGLWVTFNTFAAVCILTSRWHQMNFQQLET